MEIVTATQDMGMVWRRNILRFWEESVWLESIRKRESNYVGDFARKCFEGQTQLKMESYILTIGRQEMNLCWGWAHGRQKYGL